jgi:hypothetical protein
VLLGERSRSSSVSTESMQSMYPPPPDIELSESNSDQSSVLHGERSRSRSVSMESMQSNFSTQWDYHQQVLSSRDPILEDTLDRFHPAPEARVLLESSCSSSGQTHLQLHVDLYPHQIETSETIAGHAGQQVLAPYDGPPGFEFEKAPIPQEKCLLGGFGSSSEGSGRGSRGGGFSGGSRLAAHHLQWLAESDLRSSDDEESEESTILANFAANPEWVDNLLELSSESESDD